jgi:prohibitin 1
LRWRGIEATLQLAQSSNSKIVIVGSGKDGLPVILGNAETPQSPPAGSGEAAPKQRSTAAPPSPALDTVPADTLTKPVEKTPSTQPPEAHHYSYPIPLTLSDIEAMVSRLTGAPRPAPPDTEPSVGSSPKQPAAEQQH